MGLCPVDPQDCRTLTEPVPAIARREADARVDADEFYFPGALLVLGGDRPKADFLYAMPRM
jgi:hypothetical protein